MRIKLSVLWEQISASFWFIPGIMVIVASLMGFFLTAVDQSGAQNWYLSNMPWLDGGSPDGARSLLSTIAGSMISVAGVTFSMTLATLALASSQLGPRLLTNFMRDRGNQVVLGTFVSIFVYSLIVLRTIRSSNENLFVPHLSVIVAMFLSVISVAILVYFFHHVSTMIQAQNVVASIGRELEESVDRLISVEDKRRVYEYQLRSDDDIPTDFEESKALVSSLISGYLQAIDYKALQEIATSNDLLLRVLYRPGDFIAKGSEIAKIYPETKLSDSLKDEMLATFVFGTYRLRVQDFEFAIDQLVEIAVRALSPGINDPFTAIACLDQLGATLSSLVEHTIPIGYYYDEDGQLRIVSDSLTFSGVIDRAFNQIRQHGRSDVAVMIRLLEVIAIIVARATEDTQKQALIRQAEMIKRASNEAMIDEDDLKDITEVYNLVIRALNGDKVL